MRRRRRKLHKHPTGKVKCKKWGGGGAPPEPWDREQNKLTHDQFSYTDMTKKFPLYGTQVFITVATKGHRWTMS
jgi:hypothetical protein